MLILGFGTVTSFVFIFIAVTKILGIRQTLEAHFKFINFCFSYFKSLVVGNYSYINDEDNETEGVKVGNNNYIYNNEMIRNQSDVVNLTKHIYNEALIFPS